MLQTIACIIFHENILTIYGDVEVVCQGHPMCDLGL